MAEPATYADPGDDPKRRADVAYAMGADDHPAPGWVVDDDDAWRAYKRGLATHRTVVPFATPGKRARNTSGLGHKYGELRPDAPPAPAAPPPAGRRRRLARPAAAFRRAAPRVAGAVSGDAGGVLLALVLYPLVLVTFQHGASGPGQWFRAKWLNNVTSADYPKPRREAPDGSPDLPNLPDGPNTEGRGKGRPAPSTPGPRGTGNADRGNVHRSRSRGPVEPPPGKRFNPDGSLTPAERRYEHWLTTHPGGR